MSPCFRATDQRGPAHTAECHPHESHPPGASDRGSCLTQPPCPEAKSRMVISEGKGFLRWQPSAWVGRDPNGEEVKAEKSWGKKETRGWVGWLVVTGRNGHGAVKPHRM